MKKLILIFAVVLVTVSSVKAQNKMSGTVFSIGIEPSLPVGVFGDFYSFGIGGTLQVEYMPSSDMGLTLNAGYLAYFYKSVLGGGSRSFVPVLAGVKYRFSPKVYGHGQLGATLLEGGGGTFFTYSPGIGFQVTNSIDALLKFTGITSNGGSLNSVGLRIAYSFGK